MATTSPIVTQGYGSFGGVNYLPTLGFGIGAPPVPPVASPETSYHRVTVETSTSYRVRVS